MGGMAFEGNVGGPGEDEDDATVLFKALRVERS